jgi:glycosyltransferase involved in cell wall biosynthesis
MATDSLVSVVVPTYNRAYCLPDTIASVLAQTHGNVELIVVDDGSTDGTEALMRERYGSERRLRYLRQDNRGVSAARNKGIDAARGDVIALLDSDDTWLPWKLEVQLACMRRFPSAVMAHTEMEAVDTDGRVFDTRFLRAIYDAYERFPVSEMYEESCTVADVMPSPSQALRDARVWFGDIFSHFLTGNLVHTSTLLIARAPDGSVERYDETMRTEETFDYHLRVAKRGPVVFLDAASIRYQRGRNDHLWTPGAYPPDKVHEFACHFLRIIEPHARTAGPRMRLSPAALTFSLARAHEWIAESALGVGHHREAARHLAASLRLRPWQPRLTARMAYRALFKRRV